MVDQLTARMDKKRSPPLLGQNNNMKSCFVLALCFACYLSADAQRTCARDVLPPCTGTRHTVSLSDGCNNCICVPNSKFHACTRRLCGGKPDDGSYCKKVKKDNLEKVENARRRIRCGFKIDCSGVKKPVTVTDGCNPCKCLTGGQLVCGRMMCPRPKNDSHKKFCDKDKQETKTRIERAR